MSEETWEWKDGGDPDFPKTGHCRLPEGNFVSDKGSRVVVLGSQQIQVLVDHLNKKTEAKLTTAQERIKELEGAINGYITAGRGNSKQGALTEAFYKLAAALKREKE